MQVKKYKRFCGWMALATMFFVTSCRDDTFNDYRDGFSDETTVSFSISPEAAAVSTRAVNYSDNGLGHISDGSRADILIYAVYQIKGSEAMGDYEEILLESYGDGIDPDLAQYTNIKCGDGQTVKKVDKYPYAINLTLKKGYEYKVAFWTQNHACNSYNTLDLRKVEVIYSEFQDDAKVEEGEDSEETYANKAGATRDDENQSGTDGNEDYETTTPNNDELRDAFCRSVDIDLTNSSSDLMEKNVNLYRPLAQINVGTNGYDFEIINRERPKKYTYSKIRVNRVARYLNVVADRTYSSTTLDNPYGTSDNEKTPESFSVVDFGYAKIPAYVNMEVPDLPSHTIFDWKHNPDYSKEQEDGTIGPDNYEKIYGDEEFLRVHLYDDTKSGFSTDNALTDASGNVIGYKVGETKYTHYDDEEEYLAYANLNDHNNMMSETFKYLSMCYVLTSSTKEEPIVINNIKVWLATDDQGSDEFELFSINNVPAQRNWRTNIVGNLLTVDKEFTIKLDQDFAGDYTAWKTEGGLSEWSGPLWAGVYYNADEDVIEISSKEGLLWFQRMVNGDLVIRETMNESDLGQPYPYYDLEGTLHKNLLAKPIPEPEDEVLRERYLIATHQKFASCYDGSQTAYPDDKYYWPAGNNFHFTGSAGKTDAQNLGITRDQAYVKLTADIDLEGEEWIPIGYECRVLDQGFDTFGVNEKFGDTKTLKSVSQKKNWTYRGFFGIFDGNGHTIYNMKTKRIGAMVPYQSLQEYAAFEGSIKGTDPITGKNFGNTINYKPYDTPVWFARGLFGMIGQDAVIKNLRLVNVDIHGYNNVGGVVGCGYGRNIVIENCIVDGGKIINVPMFRGDIEDSNGKKGRTYARGANTGGIIGCLNTEIQTNKNGGEINNCEVRNLYVKAFRRMGGIIGSLELSKTNANNSGAGINGSKSQISSFCNNKISNTTIIATQFYPFNFLKNEVTNGIYQTGYGYLSDTYLSYAQTFIGGDDVDWGDQSRSGQNVKNIQGNSASNFTLTDLGIFYYADESAKANWPSFYDDVNSRICQIGKCDLGNMPMLSSWFVEKVYLRQNYYGEPSAYRLTHMRKFNIDSRTWGDTYENWTTGDGKNTFSYPMNMPVDGEIRWDTNSKKAGLYVESIILDGSVGEVGGRSVVTPDNVNGEGNCVMYVTARDRKEFQNSGIYTSGSKLDGGYNVNWYKKPTYIKKVVLRGSPYAWAGLIIAPNENMSKVTLDNVAIYDVYQTIALDRTLTKNTSSTSGASKWPNALVMNDDLELEVKESNLRGYTVPGEGWNKINYISTTFGSGGFYKEIYTTDELAKLAYTNKVEADTEFKGCYFKAPYIIDLGSLPEGKKVSFTKAVVNNKEVECQASAASTANVPVRFDNAENMTKNDANGNPQKVVQIIVTSDVQGNPEVSYYRNSTNGNGLRLITTETKASMAEAGSL